MSIIFKGVAPKSWLKDELWWVQIFTSFMCIFHIKFIWLCANLKLRVVPNSHNLISNYFSYHRKSRQNFLWLFFMVEFFKKGFSASSKWSKIQLFIAVLEVNWMPFEVILNWHKNVFWKSWEVKEVKMNELEVTT